ncbi:MAG: hypothetical protein JNM28_11305 [Armatimonadetes bacterium]|nr:hypothetical protein [Armatimonadota bacterium]
MKTWQVIAAASAVYLGGCAGFAAYVPDGNTNTGGTPLQCAALSLSGPSNMSVPQGGQNTETFTIVNGQVNALQGRTGGSGANVSFSVSGLPSGVTASFNPATANVPVDSLRNVDITFDASTLSAGSSYTITITATEQGCTPVSLSVPFNIFVD